MKTAIRKISNSGVFAIGLALLCAFFGVSDGAAMTADVVATPHDIGVVDQGAMNELDGRHAAQDSETFARESANDPQYGLLLNEVDAQVTKIRPYDVTLDTVSRHADVKKSNMQRVEVFAIETIDMAATLTTAITGSPTQANLVTSNNAIFATDETILVDGVYGYDETGTVQSTIEQLMLLVINKDSGTGNPTIIAMNGSGAQRNIIPDIPAATKLTRMGRAGSESQIRTDIYSSLPAPVVQFLQKHMAQVQMTTMYDMANKKVVWNMTDIEEEAVFDMKRGMNATHWKGIKSVRKIKNANNNIAENVYTSEGVWYQAANDFSFDGTVDLDGMVALMRMSFTGNNSGKRKLLIAGSGVIEALETMDYTTRVVREGRVEAFGIEATRIVSKFGELLIVHDQSLDDIGMADNFFVLDANFLRKWTYGIDVTTFNLRQSAQADADGRFIREICGLSLRYPTAHIRGQIGVAA